MRDRIMKNLSGAASENKLNKTPFFRAYRKYISIAACFLLLIAGAFVIYKTLDPGIVTQPFRIVDCGSLGELSDTIGFKVREVKVLPFGAEQTAYAAYLGDLPTAQINYAGEGNELSFRMWVGSEDNSGDYNEYSDIKNSSTGDISVTIKGNGGLYNLALWNSGGYSYSIRIAEGDSGAGISEEEILEAVISVE
jgi:hypothetical protein